MNCNICSHISNKLFSKKILGKYDVNYYQCTNCNFIQTDEPFWLSEAYSSAITLSDIGLFSRNIYFTEISTAMLRICGFDPTKKYLDYGAGYGVYVRMMRDNGFNFYWSDEYCENLYTKKFSADLSIPKKEYELVTAFEVFEHLVNPIKEIEKLLQYTDSILFSTLLTNSANTSIDNWWYLAPEHGQHVALYNKKTLHYIADKYKLRLYTNNSSLHLLTKKKLNSLYYKFFTRIRIAKLYNTIFQPHGLLESDYKLYFNDYSKKNNA